MGRSRRLWVSFMDLTKSESQIQYDKKIVAFIDILGFKNIIENTENDRKNLDKLYLMYREIIDSVNKLNEAKTMLKNRETINFSDYLLAISECEITLVSDSIFISINPEGYDELMKMLRSFQFRMSHDGYFLRGGITFGDVIHKSEMIFGPAVVKAYELESHHADYPRIIITTETITEIFQQIDNYMSERQGNGFIYTEEDKTKMLKQDIDGYMYIDYLTEYQEHSNNLLLAIEKNLQKADSKIVWKMEWIREKINKLAELK